MFSSRGNVNKKSASKDHVKPSRAAPTAPENRKRIPKTVEKRRAQRQAVLAPKLPPMKRLLKAAVRLMFAALVTGGVLLVGFLAYRHAISSAYFAFGELNLTGNVRLTKEEVATAAGLIDGKNIFMIDLQSARRQLLNHPWITEAEISRRLPKQINVLIVEREAVALVNLDVLYLVDDMGKVFKRWVRGDPIPSPVITGISREHYIENPKEVETILCDALDLANRYKKSSLEKNAPLDEIHREADGGFALTVGADPVYVKFGKGPYRTKLDRLGVLLSRLVREGKRPAMIYFDNEVRPDRITVKLKTDENSVNYSREGGLDNENKKMMSKNLIPLVRP